MLPSKTIQRDKDDAMLQDFLNHWPIETLHRMNLRDYNHTGDRNTFCQDVETKTRPLGSIKGNSSAKFGIYRQLNTESRPPRTISNDHYTWETKFNAGDLDEQKAFNEVITEIQQIANLAMAGDFEAIELLQINPLFRWKVAFLYSQNRLIPIFAKTKLVAIVNLQGMKANYHTPYYEMQRYLIARKPFDMTVVEYMRELFEEYRGNKKKPAIKLPRKNSRRRPMARKRGGQQKRNGHEGYTANLFHDDIQQALYEQLCDQYPPDSVLMENDWVDLIVELPEKVIIYEVKTDRYAIDCMIKGLGQALGYAFRVEQFYKKPVELVLAGPNDFSESEIEILEYLKSQLILPVSYLKINYQPL